MLHLVPPLHRLAVLYSAHAVLRTCWSCAGGRGRAIRDFQTDPPTKVFLLTYRCGGVGLGVGVVVGWGGVGWGVGKSVGGWGDRPPLCCSLHQNHRPTPPSPRPPHIHCACLLPLPCSFTLRLAAAAAGRAARASRSRPAPTSSSASPRSTPRLSGRPSGAATAWARQSPSPSRGCA